VVTGVVDLRKGLWGLYGTPYDISQVLWDLACSAVGSKGGFVGEDGSPVGIWVVNSGEGLGGSSEATTRRNSPLRGCEPPMDR